MIIIIQNNNPKQDTIHIYIYVKQRERERESLTALLEVVTAELGHVTREARGLSTTADRLDLSSLPGVSAPQHSVLRTAQPRKQSQPTTPSFEDGMLAQLPDRAENG